MVQEQKLKYRPMEKISEPRSLPMYLQSTDFQQGIKNATEANRRRGPGTREKVRSKRINLEGNTHAQEINVSQLPV
jgi:hypothetical protein